MKSQFFLAVLLLALPAALQAADEPPQPAAKPNVLFIAVDDLRTSLRCYGDPLAKSPNIDSLARSSRLFQGAYTHQAVCGPARTAMLTGRLPDNTRVRHNRNLFRNTLPDAVTLPQRFKNHEIAQLPGTKLFSRQLIVGGPDLCGATISKASCFGSGKSNRNRPNSITAPQLRPWSMTAKSSSSATTWKYPGSPPLMRGPETSGGSRGGTMHLSDSLLSFASLACEACRAYSNGHVASSCKASRCKCSYNGSAA